METARLCRLTNHINIYVWNNLSLLSTAVGFRVECVFSIGQTERFLNQLTVWNVPIRYSSSSDIKINLVQFDKIFANLDWHKIMTKAHNDIRCHEYETYSPRWTEFPSLSYDLKSFQVFLFVCLFVCLFLKYKLCLTAMSVKLLTDLWIHLLDLEIKPIL
jgi:hypothetical protein